MSHTYQNDNSQESSIQYPTQLVKNMKSALTRRPGSDYAKLIHESFTIPIINHDLNLINLVFHHNSCLSNIDLCLLPAG